MISALIGVVVMSAVTVAMLLTVDVTDKSLNKVGKYPLTRQERELLHYIQMSKIFVMV